MHSFTQEIINHCPRTNGHIYIYISLCSLCKKREERMSVCDVDIDAPFVSSPTSCLFVFFLRSLFKIANIWCVDDLTSRYDFAVKSKILCS
jgi:hypothetical protein